MLNADDFFSEGTLRRVLAGKRVLIAEDAWHLARALENVLAETGLMVIGPAASVRHAENLLETILPDLAIVDINLKGEVSYRLIDHLHAKGVPVIVITGYTSLTEPMAKTTVVLQKPFGGTALLTKVCEAIMGRSGS